MKQSENLAEALEGLFSNPEAGWFTPLSVSTNGLSAAQAVKVPAERFNSVWGVVNHVRYWQEYISMRLQGERIYREALGSKDGWPLPPGNPTLKKWEQDLERMFSANRKLAEVIRSLGDEELLQPLAAGRPSPYQVIQGVIAHNAYHSCEVITIRHMLGLWLERT